MTEIYQKIHKSIRPNGIFYASYKYAGSYMETADRDFYNMNENKVISYFNGLFDVMETWQKQDRGPAAGSDKKWLYFIARKIEEKIL